MRFLLFHPTQVRVQNFQNQMPQKRTCIFLTSKNSAPIPMPQNHVEMHSWFKRAKLVIDMCSGMQDNLTPCRAIQSSSSSSSDRLIFYVAAKWSANSALWLGPSPLMLRYHVHLVCWKNERAISSLRSALQRHQSVCKWATLSQLNCCSAVFTAVSNGVYWHGNKTQKQV